MPPAASASVEATTENAAAFIDGVNQDLRAQMPLFNAALWAQLTYLNRDTELLASRANEQFMAYQSEKLQQAKAFNEVKTDAQTARSLLQLKLVNPAPAPSDPALRSDLARVLSKMESNYGAGKWCPPDAQSCLTLPQIEKIVNDPDQPPEARARAWQGWHDTARPIRQDYARFAELGNEGARELGFADLGELWRAGYDMSPAQFDAEVERLWTQVSPLYDALHCHVRAKLNQRYGDEVVPPKGLIPAHLLGNMWAQQWSNIYPLVEPYPGVGSLDVTAALKAQRDEQYKKQLMAFKGHPTALDLAEMEHQADAAMAVKMTRVAEDFYTSLGMPALPESFYTNSLLVKPRDRDVVCHASAWDMDMAGDVRIKQCIEPDEEQLITIHHELGHIYYYLMYNPLPPLLQTAAHDGFHEAIGDTITLSLTPEHLQKIGLVDEAHSSAQAVTNAQMKLALDKIVFLPWGKLVDQWRWKVFSGEIDPQHYNQGWWDLREKYQGVSPPVARSEADFDPGAKYHIPGNTPYTRYFLAFILQFQFQKALCDAAGFDGPLYACDIYGNKKAGEKLMAMLRQGASQPWQDTLEKLTGTRQMDGRALIEYFEPLLAYLQEQNKGQSCGW
ncbi:M2 family metallopeptidase [Sinimarinibacterium sp. NLF-5-8]|nr:M2 family metallopeptidase [Sinimarinibacterium sp. NLF-5-8]